jgi:hypothetical protein
MNRRRFLSVFFLVNCSRAAAAQSVDPSARDVALRFLREFDASDPRLLYRQLLSLQFQTTVQEQLFVDSVGIGRVQSGGPAQARVLVGGHPFSQLPNGQQGQYYFVRFRGQYPSLPPTFQDVYLERVGNEWKVGGFLNSAAP